MTAEPVRVHSQLDPLTLTIDRADTIHARAAATQPVMPYKTDIKVLYVF